MPKRGRRRRTIEPFTKIARPRRLADSVADRLAAAIRSGALKPGERLPGELSLTSELGVARSVVREAIAQLRYDGLIEARQGVGAFVADPDQRRAFRISPDCFAKRQALLKLLQLRTSVSADAAGLAAGARTPAQLRRLKRCLADMQQSMRQGMEGAAARVDAEMRFYATIALASGNEYFAEFLTMLDSRILAELRSVAVKNAMAAEWGDQVLDEHRSVLAAIESRDPEAARTAAREHFARAAQRLADRADIADV